MITQDHDKQPGITLRASAFLKLDINFTRHKSQIKRNKIKAIKTRLNTQFGETLSMDAALEI